MIDLSVGILLKKKKSDYVKKGEPIAVLHANDEEKLKNAMDRLEKAYEYTSLPCPASVMIKGVVE